MRRILVAVEIKNHYKQHKISIDSSANEMKLSQEKYGQILKMIIKRSATFKRIPKKKIKHFLIRTH